MSIPNRENLKKVYENAQPIFDLPDFDTFVTDMGDEGKMARLYGNISEHFSVPDFNTFRSDMGFDVKKKEQQPSIEQPIASSESVLQPSSEQAQFGNLNAPPPASPIVNNPDGGGLLGALKTKQEQPSVVPTMATQAASAVEAAPVALTPEQERDNRIGQRVQANLGKGFSKVKSESKAIRDEFADNDNTKDAVSLYSNMFGDASMFNKDLKGDVDAFTPIINKQPTTLTSIKDIRENNVGSIKADDNVANSIWVDYVKEIDNTETPKTPDQVIIYLQEKYKDISPVSFYPIVNDLQDNYVKNYLTEVAAAKTDGKLSYTGAFLYDDYFDDGKRQLMERGFSERDIDDAISQFKEDNYFKYADQVDSELRSIAVNEFGYTGSPEGLTKIMSDRAISDGYIYMSETDRKIAAATIELNRLRGIEGEGDKTIRGGSFKTGEYSEQKSSGKTEKDFIRIAQLTEQLETLYKETGTATVYDLRTGERIQDTEVVEAFNQAVQIESERLKGTTSEVLAEAYKDSWQQMKYLERRAEWDDSDAMDRKLFEAQARFQAASKAYLLNSSVENVDKDLSYLFGVATNPFREGFGLEPTVHERDILNQTQQLFNDYNIPITETEKEKFKTTFGEIVFEMGGGVVPMVIQMAIANKVLGAAGFAEFIEDVSAGSKVLGVMANIAKEEVLFQAVGGEAGAGAGFGAAGYIPDVFRIEPTSRAWKQFANQLFKASVGATFGQEISNVTSSLVASVASDEDFNEKMEEFYGEYSDADRRILAGLIVNTMFGLKTGVKSTIAQSKRGKFVRSAQEVVKREGAGIEPSKLDEAGKALKEMSVAETDTRNKEILIATSKDLFDLAKRLEENGDINTAGFVKKEAEATKKIEGDVTTTVDYVFDRATLEKKKSTDIEISKLEQEKQTKLREAEVTPDYMERAREITKEYDAKIKEVETGVVEKQKSDAEISTENAVKTVVDNLKKQGLDATESEVAAAINREMPSSSVNAAKKRVPDIIRSWKGKVDKTKAYGGIPIEPLVVPVWNAMVEQTARAWEKGSNIYEAARKVFDKRRNSELFTQLGEEKVNDLWGGFMEEITKIAEKHGEKNPGEEALIETVESMMAKEKKVTNAITEAKNKFRESQRRRSEATGTAIEEVKKARQESAKEKAQMEKDFSRKEKKLKKELDKARAKEDRLKSVKEDMDAARELYDEAIKSVAPDLHALSGGKVKTILNQYNNAKTPDAVVAAGDKLIKYASDAAYRYNVNRAFEAQATAAKRSAPVKFSQYYRPIVARLLKLNPMSMGKEALADYNAILKDMNANGVLPTDRIEGFTNKYADEIANQFSSNIEHGSRIKKLATYEDVVDAINTVGEKMNDIKDKVMNGQDLSASDIVSLKSSISRIKGKVASMSANGELAVESELSKNIDKIERDIQMYSADARSYEMLAKENAIDSATAHAEDFIRDGSTRLNAKDKTLELSNGSKIQLSNSEYKMVYDFVSHAAELSKFKAADFMDIGELDAVSVIFENINNGNITPQAYKSIQAIGESKSASKMVSGVLPKIRANVSKSRAIRDLMKSSDKLTKALNRQQAMRIGEELGLIEKSYDPLANETTAKVLSGLIEAKQTSDALMKEVTHIDSDGTVTKVNLNKIISKYGRNTRGRKRMEEIGLLMAHLDAESNISNVKFVENKNGKISILSQNGKDFVGEFDTVAEAKKALPSLIAKIFPDAASRDYIYQLVKEGGAMESYHRGNTVETNKDIYRIKKAYDRLKKRFGFGENDFFEFSTEASKRGISIDDVFNEKMAAVMGSDYGFYKLHEGFRKFFDSKEVIDMYHSVASMEGVYAPIRNNYFPKNIQSYAYRNKFDGEIFEIVDNNRGLNPSTKFGNLYPRAGEKVDPVNTNPETAARKYASKMAIASTARQSKKEVSGMFGRIKKYYENKFPDEVAKIGAIDAEVLKMNDGVMPTGVKLEKDRKTASDNLEITSPVNMTVLSDAIKETINTRLRAELSSNRLFDTWKVGAGRFQVDFGSAIRTTTSVKVAKLIASFPRVMIAEFATNMTKTITGGAGSVGGGVWYKTPGNMLPKGRDYREFMRSTYSAGAYYAMKNAMRMSKYQSPKAFNSSKLQVIENTFAGIMDAVAGGARWKTTFEQKFKELTGSSIDYQRIMNDAAYSMKHAESLNDAISFANGTIDYMAPSAVQFGRAKGLLSKEGSPSDFGAIMSTLMSYQMNESREFLNSLRNISRGLSGVNSGSEVANAVAQFGGLMGSGMMYWFTAKLARNLWDMGVSEVKEYFSGEDDGVSDIAMEQINKTLSKESLLTAMAGNLVQLTTGTYGGLSKAAASSIMSLAIGTYLDNATDNPTDRNKEMREIKEALNDFGVYSFFNIVPAGKEYGKAEDILLKWTELFVPLVADGVIDIKSEIQDLIPIINGTATPTEQQMRDIRVLDLTMTVSYLLGAAWIVPADVKRYSDRMEQAKREQILGEKKQAEKEKGWLEGEEKKNQPKTEEEIEKEKASKEKSKQTKKEKEEFLRNNTNKDLGAESNVNLGSDNGVNLGGDSDVDLSGDSNVDLGD